MPPPDIRLLRYWIHHVRVLAGSLYGRKMYEVMRYWDADDPAWQEHDIEFTLVRGDLESFVREPKTTVNGTIAVAGPEIAGHRGCCVTRRARRSTHYASAA